MTVPIPESTLQDLEDCNVVARLWQRDHTLWKPDPTEITNRLGWLTVADEMQSHLPALEAFFHEVRDAGIGTSSSWAWVAAVSAQKCSAAACRPVRAPPGSRSSTPPSPDGSTAWSRQST